MQWLRHSVLPSIWLPYRGKYLWVVFFFLYTGSRRLFGVILEDDVCILIDTSGSMEPTLEEVIKELTSLIWDQLRKYNVRYVGCQRL